jgi:hypothetical protein
MSSTALQSNPTNASRLTATAASSLDTDIADTYGWDTVFAIYFTDVNKAIVAQKSTPATFGGSMNNPFGGTVEFVNCNWSDWQLVKGGDGKNVHMITPIKSGIFRSSGGDINLAGAEFIIEVNLDYIPQPSSKDNTIVNSLQVNTQAGTATDPTVSVLNTVIPGQSDPIVLSTIGGLVKNWFNNNLGLFNHVFAVVDVAENLSKDSGWGWITPTWTSYAVVDHPQTSQYDSVFGVLTMTDNSPATNLAHQISPFAIPGVVIQADGSISGQSSYNSGFLVGTNVFMKNMLLPHMMSLFKNASESDFSLVENGQSITTNKNLQFQDWDIPNHSQVTASIAAGDFNVTVENTELIFSMDDIHFEWSPGIDVHINYDSRGVIAWNDSLESFDFTITNQHMNTSVTTATWVTVVEVVGSIAAACVAGFLGVACAPETEAAEQAGADIAENEAQNVVQIEMQQVGQNVGADMVNGVEEGEAAGAEVEAAQEGEGYLSQFKGWFARNWIKIRAAMIASFAGALAGSIAPFCKIGADLESQNLAAVKDFAGKCVDPITFANQTKDGNNTGFTVKQVALNKSLQFGGVMDFDHNP